MRPFEDDATTPFDLDSLRRRWRLVAVLTLVGALAGLLVTTQRDTPHRAMASVIVRVPGTGTVFGALNSEVTDPARHVADQATILDSSPVAIRAIQLLDERVPDHGFDVRAMREHSEVEWTPGSDVIRVFFSADDAATAVTAVNSLVRAYEEVADARSVNFTDALAELDASIEATRASIDDLQSQIAALEGTAGAPLSELQLLLDRRAQAVERESALLARRDQLAVDAELEASTIRWASRAVALDNADSRWLLGFIAGAILGATFGVALVYWLRPLRRRVLDASEAEAALRAPALAELPPLDVALPVATQESSPASDRLWSLSRVLEPPPAGPDDTLPRRDNVLAFVSANADRNRTVVALNVGAALSMVGRPVVVISTEWRNSGLAALLSAAGAEPPARDLVDVLRDPPLARWATQAAPFAAAPMVDTLSCRPGEKSPRDLFASPRFAEVLDRLTGHYAAVVLDVPPVLEEPYATDVIRQAGRTVAVVGHRAPLAGLRELRHRFDLHGLVLDNCVYVGDTERPGPPRLPVHGPIPGVSLESDPPDTAAPTRAEHEPQP